MTGATAQRAPTRTAGSSSPVSLATIRKGTRHAPDRILLVGTEGIGKSTFAADAPAPIFICAEDGINHLDVASFPEARTLAEVMGALDVLRTEAHEYKTLVVDTVDWLEALIWSDLCQRSGWDSIESPGYGKGYAVALDEWRKLIRALDTLRNEKGMEIILVAHAAIKPFSNPAGTDYSRYECKLHRGAAALLREWTDTNLFAVHEDFVKTKTTKDATGKGISTGRRVLKTQRCAAWDAKNRAGLPPELPLSYADYAAAREAGQTASPATLEAEALTLLDELGGTDERKAAGAARIKTAGGNATALAKLVDLLRTQVSQKEGN